LPVVLRRGGCRWPGRVWRAPPGRVGWAATRAGVLPRAGGLCECFGEHPHARHAAPGALSLSLAMVGPGSLWA
jgi:hypothetical protein